MGRVLGVVGEPVLALEELPHPQVRTLRHRPATQQLNRSKWVLVSGHTRNRLRRPDRRVTEDEVLKLGGGRNRRLVPRLAPELGKRHAQRLGGPDRQPWGDVELSLEEPRPSLQVALAGLLALSGVDRRPPGAEERGRQRMHGPDRVDEPTADVDTKEPGLVRVGEVADVAIERHIEGGGEGQSATYGAPEGLEGLSSGRP